ncbi:secretory immunoglobulin A-binding protein EsiB-like isoform X2 [Carcharodon carcharias]|nr:secretory immunoglobulin A-binding protein EsiB-like isoform X2 [Carcharodon carcharias]
MAISFLLYLALYYEAFHVHLTLAYAHLGYATAQHSIGQRYLQGNAVTKCEDTAMKWFRKAAERGHPHSSYNLAVGKLKEMATDVEDGELEGLLSRAAEHGLKEAQDILDHLYKKPDDS